MEALKDGDPLAEQAFDLARLMSSDMPNTECWNADGTGVVKMEEELVGCGSCNITWEIEKSRVEG